MNEICKNCGKAESKHYGISGRCYDPYRNDLTAKQHNLFYDDGKYVSVPVELLKDLWKLYNQIDIDAEDFDSVMRKHIAIFDQMEGGGK
jgi:hypothetical protein